MPSLKQAAREAIRRRRRAGVRWVRVLDTVRELGSAAGRARLWVRLAHGGAVHQITEYTEPDRYPRLFRLAADLRPDAKRILSFGCSTGEEIEAIRRQFPEALIVGAEINPRSRNAARKRLAADPHVRIVKAVGNEGPFDIVFALAVLQFQPHRVADEGVTDLSSIYAFQRFDRKVSHLVGLLSPGGLLCVMHAHYRVEDSSAFGQLRPVDSSPSLDGPLFGPNGRILEPTPRAASMYFKP